MKKQQLLKLREMSLLDLQKFVQEKKHSLLTSSTKITAGKMRNIKEAKNLRREIAVAQTILSEKGGKDERKTSE